MVKKRVGGSKRYKVSADSSKTNGSSPAPKLKGPPPPKHLQRKIARKVGFLDKVASSAAVGLSKGSGVSKKSRSKASTALNNLSSLTGVLDEVSRDLQQASDAAQRKKANQKAFGEAVKHNKTRSTIQASETARMRDVLQHPVFKSNPIAAITNHLKSTLPSPPPKPAAGKAGKQLSKQERKKMAKQKKKQQQGPGEMEQE